jgi:hypothetical protein
MNEPKEPKEQRFAKALDTFASTDVIEMIRLARQCEKVNADPDGAFNWLEGANNGLPETARLIPSPKTWLIEESKKIISLEDFRKRNRAYMKLSPQNLEREYAGQILQFKLDQVEPTIAKIMDAMQRCNLLYQETRKWHKSDAPQISVI